MEQLFDSTFSFAETFDDSDEENLFTGEEDLIAGSIPSRRREFVTARACAREALARINVSPVAIRSGLGREPLWPPGIKGSITHCAGYRGAVVTASRTVAGVGVDAEPNAPLPDQVVGLVALPAEAKQIAFLQNYTSTTHWDRLLFSAKESVYKAWYPATQRWLGFEDAHIIFDPSAWSFSINLVGEPPWTNHQPLQMTGRYAVTDGLVATAVVLRTFGPTGQI